ncbi:MAG: hypothetical protein GY869_23355 [Planctomycetes bacterium]|nr:hypothetical protein [Planctomycetota bacterium]
MTPSQAMDIGSHLIQLLTKQRLLYRQLRELAQKQSDLVDGSNPELLLRVLAARQRIIDRLRGIDKELKPIRDEWRQIASMLPSPQQQEAQKLVAEVQEILGEIIARDEKDTKTLSDQQQHLAGEMQTAAAGKRVHQAYAQSSSQGVQSRLNTLSS